MNVDQDRHVLSVVRGDHRQYGREIFLPEDMPEDEIARQWGDAVKKGLIKKITRTPVLPPAKTEEEAAARKAAEAAKAGKATQTFLPPPTTQIYGASFSSTVSQAHVTGAIAGPCMLDHILFYTVSVGTAGANIPMEIALHACTSPDQAPFSGDMTIFRMEDPQDLLGILDRSAIQLYKHRYETLVGWQPMRSYELFPRMVMPWETFYLNLTVGKTNHPAAVYCTVDFGPLEAARASITLAGKIMARPSEAPVGVKAVKAAPRWLGKTYTSYADIKADEIRGARINWASLRGIPGQPNQVYVEMMWPG